MPTLLMNICVKQRDVMIYRWETSYSKNEAIKKLVGFVEINVPKSEERMLLLKEINLKYEDGKAVFNLDHIDTMIKISKMVGEKISRVEVSLNDKAITNFEELEYYSFFQDLVNELSSVLFSGIPLGN
jgi:hypothetical protein